MVGIMIVSHSRGIAEGTREMAMQMAGEHVLIAACGGNKAGGIGTDPDAIGVAIRNIWSPDGLVVLADLGSAVMSAEMVIEMLPDEMRERIAIVNAPIVEGAILAAVEASMGKPLAGVAAAAEAASHMSKVNREG